MRKTEEEEEFNMVMENKIGEGGGEGGVRKERFIAINNEKSLIISQLGSQNCICQTMNLLVPYSNLLRRMQYKFSDFHHVAYAIIMRL